jgi:hypothetical protein
METATLWIKNCNIGGRFAGKLDMLSVVRTAAQHNSLLGPMDEFPMTVIMAGHLNGWLSWHHRNPKIPNLDYDRRRSDTLVAVDSSSFWRESP